MKNPLFNSHWYLTKSALGWLWRSPSRISIQHLFRAVQTDCKWNFARTKKTYTLLDRATREGIVPIWGYKQGCELGTTCAVKEYVKTRNYAVKKRQHPEIDY